MELLTKERMSTHQATTSPSFLCRTFVRTLTLATLALFVATAAHAQEEGDPPERVARLSYLAGNVSLEPAGVSDFSQAEANYPLTNGDRIYVDNTSRAELQSAGLAVRMADGADLTLTSLTDQFAQLGLAQGSIHVRSWSLPSGGGVEIDTPNGTITVTQPGDIRIDSYPQDDTTLVTVNSGQVEVTGPSLSEYVSSGQALKLTGSNPIYAQPVQLYPPDDFDSFDRQRDQIEQAARSAQQQYVNPDMIGYSDLNQYGEWAPEPEYGAVWYPRGVVAGWTPYHYGHWAWIAPWGWTWVESEPWGFAPFHYGRWAVFNGRWGWIPGPPIVRPVYSPALVAFVGGSGFSISVNIGGGGGIAAWFPLGPREPYIPWYHASTAYVNRVNVTNIYNRNVTEVRNVYINKTTNIYVNKTTINNITYVNRNVATTAVPQHAFAAGRPVAQSAVRVDQRQLAQAQIIQHPMVTPAKAIMAPAPARAVPVNVQRPMLQTRSGLAQAVPGAHATPVPVHPLTPQQQHEPARPTAQVPQQARQQVENRTQTPEVQQPRPEVQQQPAREIPHPAQQQQRPEQQRPAPAPVAAQRPAPQQRPAEQARPLVNRSEPPAPQPNFEQQRQAIERNDPGRPLGPHQVENIRNGRPAGPAQQPEVIGHAQPHAAPERSAPPAREPHR